MFEMNPKDIKPTKAENGRGLSNSVVLPIPILTQDILMDLADCLMQEKAQNAQDSVEGLENAGAQYLKNQIETGKFLLISSDRQFNNWF